MKLDHTHLVILAKAGIQQALARGNESVRAPAFAGVTQAGGQGA